MAQFTIVLLTPRSPFRLNFFFSIDSDKSILTGLSVKNINPKSELTLNTRIPLSPSFCKPKRIYFFYIIKRCVFFRCFFILWMRISGRSSSFRDGPNAMEMHEHPLLPKSTMCFYCYYYSSSFHSFS